MVMDEASTVEMHLSGSLNSSRFSGEEGGVMDCEMLSSWFWRRWGVPGRRNIGGIGVCCQSIRPTTLQPESDDLDTMMLFCWRVWMSYAETTESGVLKDK